MVQLQMAGTRDIAIVMEFIYQAKAHLHQLGIDQWQDGYPDVACIENDIALGNGYLLAEDGTAMGYLSVGFNGDASYENINGQWKSVQPYGVVHRLTIGDAFKGRGLAAVTFRLVEALCAQRGIHSIKVDTDAANLSMKKILQKSGFTYCGTIRFDNSEKIAYEKLV